MSAQLKHWKAIAASNPGQLIRELSYGNLPSWELSFAAEAAGAVPAAREALLGLLGHHSPTVREGAIYGLSRQIDDDPKIRELLVMLARADRSGSVREAATEALSP